MPPRRRVPDAAGRAITTWSANPASAQAADAAPTAVRWSLEELAQRHPGRSVEVRVPFTLAADAKLPMTPTVVIKWNCCDEETCYNETATKPPLGVEITAPPAAPEGPGMADSAPVAPVFDKDDKDPEVSSITLAMRVAENCIVRPVSCSDSSMMTKRKSTMMAPA